MLTGSAIRCVGLLLPAALLCGCGPDAVTAAGTAATLQAKSAQQALEQKKQIETQLQAAQQAEQRRLDDAEGKAAAPDPSR